MIKKYNDGIKEFCKTNNLPFVDLFGEWFGSGYKNLLIDGLHPNSDGHEKIYHKVKQTLEKNKI
jgi:lysophospholipase L1-like esterase